MVPVWDQTGDCPLGRRTGFQRGFRYRAAASGSVRSCAPPEPAAHLTRPHAHRCLYRGLGSTQILTPRLPLRALLRPDPCDDTGDAPWPRTADDTGLTRG